jgi:hypothetical protein
MFNNPDKRYQECNFLEKLWRRRLQLRIPWEVFKVWVKCRIKGDDTPLVHIWSIEIGMSHMDMKWTYTSKEIEKEFRLDYIDVEEVE